MMIFCAIGPRISLPTRDPAADADDDRLRADLLGHVQQVTGRVLGLVVRSAPGHAVAVRDAAFG